MGDVGAGGFGAGLVNDLLEQFTVLATVDGFQGSTDQFDIVLLQDAGLAQRHGGVDAIGDEGHGIVGDKGGHQAVDDGAYPAPVVHYKGGPVDEEVQHAGGHRGQHGQPIDGPVDDRVKLSAVCHLVEPCEHRVKGRQGRVLHLGGNLAPG